ncbi:uncharacterized protein LOC134326808 isoform X3 [Trichomycterus rosablanca]|uniref:uncharacterized protein LOC134305713 isoform X3 n=1 Tax=Trichomycterus rosablanca TaxID=2290929 RepID=UPI002F35EBA8
MGRCFSWDSTRPGCSTSCQCTHHTAMTHIPCNKSHQGGPFLTSVQDKARGFYLMSMQRDPSRWPMSNQCTWADASQGTGQGQGVLPHVNAPTIQQGLSRRFIPNQCAPVDRTVLEALREMDLKINYLTSLVESLVGGRRILPPQQQDDEDLNVIPLDSVEALENLEERLLSNGLKQRMINMLSLSGGHTMKKTIWRIASKVFTPNLAKSLNWCGRGDKRGLKQTACGQVIIAAAMKNPVLPAPTEAEAENCLKDYLRLATRKKTLNYILFSS